MNTMKAKSGSLIDGKAIAADVRASIKSLVDERTALGNRAPFLSVILVGEDPGSASYVRGKHRAAADAGIQSENLTFPDTVTEEEILNVVDQLNHNSDVDGILVQLPLPPHIDGPRVINAISPLKDVDCFHPENVGRLMLGLPGLRPATPAGILELLRRSGIQTSGKHAVIVGRSNIVGKPLANMLIQKGVDATVTVCHSRTPNLRDITSQADILIAAIGRSEFITADMVKKGAVVIDVGINRVEDASRERGYRLTGDVAFESVSRVASFITPVPGGVGPMTIALMLQNTLEAAEGMIKNKD